MTCRRCKFFTNNMFTKTFICRHVKGELKEVKGSSRACENFDSVRSPEYEEGFEDGVEEGFEEGYARGM